MTFDRSDRTYHVTDERLRAFRALSAETKLRWVEDLATFIRLTREEVDRLDAGERAADDPAASRRPAAAS